MKQKLLVGLLFWSFLVGMANATVITTATGIENLEWLEFDKTIGLSRDSVETTLLMSGQQYFGYQYATLTQASTLLDSYYTGNIKDVDDGWRISTAAAAFNFINDFTLFLIK